VGKLSILSIVRKIAGAAVTVTMAAGCSLVSGYQIAPIPTAGAPTVAGSGCNRGHMPVPPYVGVIEHRLGQVPKFSRATGAHPRVVAYFERFGSPFVAGDACRVIRFGAIPLIQIDPTDVSIAKIGRGKYHKYLTDYAKAVRKFHAPVAISFGHEMNGTWYTWGYKDTPPAEFVQAWRVIHTTFAAAGASNVTWVWTVNSIYPNDIPLRRDWPGKAYVNWVGIDAYYWHATDTFDSMFGTVLDAVRPITHDPVLIAETAAAPGPQERSQIQSLFAGVRRNHLLGLVWFDINANRPWRLEGHPAALAAFRRAVKQYMR